ncbi:urokinase-type plasminogen activator-like [Discoglossus pictus]
MKILLTLLISCVLITGLESKPHKTPKQDPAECTCLNGGICQRYRPYRGRFLCSCPGGYTGKHCDIDTRSHCYTGRGVDYRGTASKTSHGVSCLHWDSPRLIGKPFNAQQEGALQLGLGKHNHCRNPDKRRKPWCYFQRGEAIYSATCQLTKCKPEKTSEPTCGRRQNKKFKIMGGGTSSIESQPWIAALYVVIRKNTLFQGGASLIHPCWVLTAAHCFGSDPDPKDFIIILGKSTLDETNEEKEQKFQVEKIILHPKYSYETGAEDNDIALVKIRSASGQCASLTDSVQTVCLPPAGLNLRDATQCEVSGYAIDPHNLIIASSLKTANVQLIPQSLCQSERYYGKYLNNNMLCAGDPEWKADSCKGDSGGPLTCEYNGQMMLYGIVSWGVGCATENKPGVYTRVTKYLPWINQIMAENNNMGSKMIPK